MDQYEQSLCPGCGQSHTRSLFNKDADTHPTYLAGFVECLGCKELLNQQETQRVKDATVQHGMQKPFKENPHQAPQLVTGHRHWRAWETPPPGTPDTTPTL